MKAEELVIVARLADHYERNTKLGDEALAAAERDFVKFKREAPRTWRHLYGSSLSSREIGDRIYELIARWWKSGMSFKNFAADEEDLSGFGDMRTKRLTPLAVARIDEAAGRWSTLRTEQSNGYWYVGHKVERPLHADRPTGPQALVFEVLAGPFASQGKAEHIIKTARSRAEREAAR